MSRLGYTTARAPDRPWPAVHDGSQTVIPPRGTRDSRKAVAVNKRHPYRELEREYITTDISITELCRRHGIRSHSVMVDQSQKHDWPAKHEACRPKESESFIETYAERVADRQAQISDSALDAVDAAITKLRVDMRATDQKRIDGGWVEVPAWYEGG